MTRKRSRRELENAVDDLAGDVPAEDAATVHEWVSAHLGSGLKDVMTGNYTIYGADGEIVEKPDHSGEVCIWRATGDVGTEIWTDAADVPEWIDADEDLPVGGQGVTPV